jgi:hypothetical protein
LAEERQAVRAAHAEEMVAEEQARRGHMRRELPQVFTA